ncbi:uncharacterized protein [Macrobrachium rosenbergii]|uniref:uncharacterized protein isoform X2 n=1 Tax=Macrobrachium rosenbergii TaxID=79674 RepID=UPI0034D3AEAD
MGDASRPAWTHSTQGTKCTNRQCSPVAIHTGKNPVIWLFEWSAPALVNQIALDVQLPPCSPIQATSAVPTTRSGSASIDGMVNAVHPFTDAAERVPKAAAKHAKPCKC